MTQGMLAHQAGISQSNLSRIESEQNLEEDTLQRVAAVLGIELSDDPHSRGVLESSLVRQWLPAERLRTRMRRPQIPVETRWNQARITLGRDAVNGWLRHAIRYDEWQVWEKILGHVNVDSSVELVYMAQHLLEGALLARLRALRLGYRRHAIVDPITLHNTSDCPRWGLVLREDRVRIALIPYVTVLARLPRPPRLDFLGMALIRGHRYWFDLEIDGPQHVAHEDEQRERLIGLPTFRVPWQIVLRPGAREALLSWVGRDLVADPRAAARLPAPWL